MKISAIDKNQLIKIIKAGLYSTGSALITYLLLVLQNNPDMFGVVLVPLVNIVIVVVKQLFTTPE